MGKRFVDEELLQILARAIIDLEGNISEDSYSLWATSKEGAPNYRTFCRHFGTWSKAVQLARNVAEAEFGKTFDKSDSEIDSDSVPGGIPPKLLKLLRKGASLLDLADAADISPKRVLTYIEALRAHDQVVLQEGDRYKLLGIVPGPEDKVSDFGNVGRSLILGVVSDTHLGSKFQQISMLNNCYDWFEKEGVKHVIHCGDLVEGDGTVYSGQLFEIFLQGHDAPRDYVVKEYPRREGITTWILSGNHDDSFIKSSGYNVVRDICSQREDFRYLGRFGAYVQVNQAVRIYVWHGSRLSRSYALSYRLQRTIEGFSSENKPQILLAGHLHGFLWMAERNVEAFLVPCFQAQTPFLRSKGWTPTLGGLILRLDFAKSGNIRRISVERQPQYAVIPDDYPHQY